MHAARLTTSARLQRVQALLADGREHSTRAIVRGAVVCAVNSCVAELRTAGAVITCRQRTGPGPSRRFVYRMVAPAGTQMGEPTRKCWQGRAVRQSRTGGSSTKLYSKCMEMRKNDATKQATCSVYPIRSICDGPSLA